MRVCLQVLYFIHTMQFSQLGRSISNVSAFNKKAKVHYDGMVQEDRQRLKQQAKISSETSFFVEKKIRKEGRKIFNRIGDEVRYSIILLVIFVTIIVEEA